ncbi:MAG: hypothetical protein KAY37_09430 [Phycisphaerae bacterium]|nr:hypothetical protein [Phycisphaerae bacterium]
MSRPNLFTLDTWGRHENLVLEVFQCALVRLESESELPEDERELNRKLYFRAKEENLRLTRAGRGLGSTIIPDSPNPPIDENAESRARESKRPDFQCELIDAQAGEYLVYALECKRLGRPKPSGWVLNRNYTKHGVQRFMDPESGYGEGAESGAMIGYLQTMSPDEILKEVNGHAKKVNMPSIHRETDEWIDRGVTRLDQTLNRMVSPSPFRLRHLWIDLRHRYSTEASARRGALNGD